MKAKWTKRFWQWHSACAIYSGAFLAFILFTGAVAVFVDPLYRLEFRDAMRIEPAPLDLATVPQAIDSATALLDTDGQKPTVSSIQLPKSDSDPLRISFYNRNRASSPFSLSQPWYAKSVFTHPQTGDVIGQAEDGRSIAAYLRLIHVRLFAGTPGRNFVGLFGLALLFVSLTGLAILFKFLGKKALWVIRRNSPRNVNSDTHKLLGFVLLLPALIFAITGFWLGMQGRLMQWFDIERPDRFERPALISAEADAAWPIDFARTLAAVEAAHPKLVPQLINWSQDGERSIRVSGRVPGTLYERYSQGVVLDKETLEPLKVVDTANADWKENLFYLQEALHFGDFAGIGTRFIYLAVGIMLAALPVTGYAITLYRSRRSFRKFWIWTAISVAYAIGSLLFLKSFGLIPTMAYGTIALWTFVAALAIWWILVPAIRAIRHRASKPSRELEH